MSAKECTIMVNPGETEGMDFGTMIATFYGEISPWHQSKKSANEAIKTLRATGDWPDGRPAYWIEEGHQDIPW